MDDLTFVREKLRRELQELLNSLDSASSSEGIERERHDALSAARCIVSAEAVDEYIHAVKAAYIDSRS